MTEHQVRLGVDIGGTFTDVVLEAHGKSFSTKVLTTYAAPEDAIIDGMKQVCAKAGIAPSAIGQVIHGTTLATNALIERRGAKTALITTEGFRDVIEMRTESRFEQYDLNLNLPEPLLPRQSRFTVTERVNVRRDVLIPLNMEEVDQVINAIGERGYESVAIGLIHSYIYPDHEQMIRDRLQEKLPHVAVSISSEVSPQMREYERFNTVVANAYIKPLMASYLGRLEGRMQAEGIMGRIFLMHSGGGIISIESAAAFPVRLVESGPAGGAVFAAHIAARYNLDKVLSFDMGGTTAKICLIKNKTPKTSRVFEVARTYRFKKGSGMPISIPVIDMVEIGAGGGSLAHVDNLRQIRVGPESAGSEPGPACYGRGGERPAVTDADLMMGKLDPDHFAGGSIKLYPEQSQHALDAHIGTPLGMPADAMHRHPVGDHVILGSEADAAGKERCDGIADMRAGKGHPECVLAHAGAGGIGHFLRVDMKLRSGEVTKAAGMVVMKMSDDDVVNVTGGEPKRLDRLDRRTLDRAAPAFRLVIVIARIDHDHPLA